MQYFTFLGLGPKQGYSELITQFDGDDEDTFEVEKFVQIPIYKRFADEIDEVGVFVTKAARERNFEELKKGLSGVNVYPIEISDYITTEEFIGLLEKYLKPGEKVILDTTHSFRSLPMRLLFAVKCLEEAKNVQIEHLFYGQVLYQNDDSRRRSVILDSIEDYRLQQVGDLLLQFEKTLIVSPEDWKNIVESDPKITAFLENLSRFNDMLETCDFNKGVRAVQNIVNGAKNLQKDPAKYALILPLAEKIIQKFETVKGTDKEQKLALIRILMDHRRYQLAVTFADNLFREELLRKVMAPNSRAALNVENLALQFYASENYRDKMNWTPNFLYDASQYIRNNMLKGYIPGPREEERRLDRLEDLISAGDLVSLRTYYRSNEPVIDNFFNNIRNQMQHGMAIADRKKFEKNVNSMLNVIAEM